MYGQQEAGWLSFYDYFKKATNLINETAKLEGVLEVAQSANWWLPCENICFVSDRPEITKLDDNGVIHCEDGPAIKYRDGFSVHAWHGTRIPSEWIERSETLTPEMAITWENVEQRRCIAEILGWHNILTDKRLNARTINKDENPQIGELIEVDIPDIGTERFLKVLCGTKRDFALPVPPDMNTALDAQAWLNFCTTDDILNLETRT